MTVFDVCVLVVVGLSALFALSRGFTTELLSLGAWAGAVLALRLLFAPVSGWMRTQIHSPVGADLATLALVFLGSFYLCKFIASTLGGKVKQSGLGPVDRVLGMGFGIIRGLLIVSIAYAGIGLMIDRQNMPDWVQTAKVKPLIDYGADTVTAFTRQHQDGVFHHPAVIDADGNRVVPAMPHPESDDGYSDEQRKELEKVLQDQQQQTKI